MEQHPLPQRRFPAVAGVVADHQNLTVVLALDHVDGCLLPRTEGLHVPAGGNERRRVPVGPWTCHARVLLRDVDPFGCGVGADLVGLDGYVNGEAGDGVADLVRKC